MENRWFKNAVIYCVDVDTFRDGNGDGIGEPTKIFAHSCQDENGNAVIAAHNLTEAPIKVVIKLWEKTFDHFIHLFDERPNEKIKKAEIGLELPAFGFSWLRLRQKKQI
jgi:hypothetical protein